MVGGDRGRIGARGEIEVAKILEQGARDGVVVLHDLNIPGSPANIDHVVISGRDVWLVDTKVWKGGHYVTIAGRTRRTSDQGFAGLFRQWTDAQGQHPADKRTLEMARDRLRPHLPHGVRVGLAMIVLPSGRGEVRLRWYRPAAGARPMTGGQAGRWIAGLTAPADPGVVAAMRRFIR